MSTQVQHESNDKDCSMVNNPSTDNTAELSNPVFASIADFLPTFTYQNDPSLQPMLNSTSSTSVPTPSTGQVWISPSGMILSTPWDATSANTINATPHTGIYAPVWTANTPGSVALNDYLNPAPNSDISDGTCRAGSAPCACNLCQFLAFPTAQGRSHVSNQRTTNKQPPSHTKYSHAQSLYPQHVAQDQANHHRFLLSPHIPSNSAFFNTPAAQVNTLNLLSQGNIDLSSLGLVQVTPNGTSHGIFNSPRATICNCGQRPAHSTCAHLCNIPASRNANEWSNSCHSAHFPFHSDQFINATHAQMPYIPQQPPQSQSLDQINGLMHVQAFLPPLEINDNLYSASTDLAAHNNVALGWSNDSSCRNQATVHGQPIHAPSDVFSDFGVYNIDPTCKTHANSNNTIHSDYRPSKYNSNLHAPDAIDDVASAPLFKGGSDASATKGLVNDNDILSIYESSLRECLSPSPSLSFKMTSTGRTAPTQSLSRNATHRGSITPMQYIGHVGGLVSARSPEPPTSNDCNSRKDQSGGCVEFEIQPRRSSFDKRSKLNIHSSHDDSPRASKIKKSSHINVQDEEDSDEPSADEDELDRNEGKVKKKNRHMPPKWACPYDFCQKVFRQSTHLKTHLRTHSGEKPYKCNFPRCEKSFSQMGNLSTHRRHHTGEKPFVCKDCRRSFAQLGNLRTHERMHTGFRPYTCLVDQCGREFSQLGNLRTHQLRVHKIPRRTDLAGLALVALERSCYSTLHDDDAERDEEMDEIKDQEQEYNEAQAAGLDHDPPKHGSTTFAKSNALHNQPALEDSVTALATVPEHAEEYSVSTSPTPREPKLGLHHPLPPIHRKNSMRRYSTAGIFPTPLASSTTTPMTNVIRTNSRPYESYPKNIPNATSF